MSEWQDTMVREYTGQSVRTISGKRNRTNSIFKKSIAIKIVKGANMVRCWMKVMGTRGEIRRND